jgi:iron complex transport system ATP-binding protein
MIALDDITVRIGEATLLGGATTAVRPGRLTAVVGANGAGKTTLLRVASGEQVPTEGIVRMDDTPLNSLSAETQARQRAVLPQHARLGFAFPVFEVVLMGRTPHTRGAAETSRGAEITAAALEAVAMTDFADRAYPTLSGGEQQRVHLARALAQVWEAPTEGGRYLLLDEPTASLDLAHQHGVLRTARSFADEGAGVLAVLHDLNLAAQYADHVVVLSGGEVLTQGAPADVLTSETIRTAFDVPVLVQPHPCRECPLVIPAPDGVRSPSNRVQPLATSR